MENEKLNQILDVVLEKKEDVKDLKIRVTNLEKRVTKIEQNVESLSNNFDLLSGRVDKLQNNYNELNPIAMELKDLFILTKNYIEKEHKEAIEERKINAEFREKIENLLKYIIKGLSSAVV